MELDIIVHSEDSLRISSVFQVPASTPLQLYDRIRTFLKAWPVLDEAPFEAEARAQIIECLDSNFAPWMDERGFGVLVRTLAGNETFQDLLATRNTLLPILSRNPTLCMMLMVISIQFRFFIARTELFGLYSAFAKLASLKIESFDLANELYLIAAHCAAANAQSAAQLIAKVEKTQAITDAQTDAWLTEISHYGSEELFLAALGHRPNLLSLDIKRHALRAAEKDNLVMCQFFTRIAQLAAQESVTDYRFAENGKVAASECEHLDTEIATKAVIYNKKSLLMEYLPLMEDESLRTLFWVTVQENRSQFAMLVAAALYSHHLEIPHCDELIRLSMVKERLQMLEALCVANPEQFTHRSLYLVGQKISSDFYPIPELPECATLLPLKMMADYISSYGIERSLRHELDRLLPGAATRLRLRAGQAEIYATLVELLRTDVTIYQPLHVSLHEQKSYKKPLVYVGISIVTIFLVGIFALLVRRSYQ